MVITSWNGTSAIIALAKIGHLALLKNLFKKVIIPKAVYEEIVVKGRGRSGTEELKDQPDWLVMKTVRNRDAVNLLEKYLGKGEAEVIVLAKELNADLVVIDEIKARNIAQLEGLTTIGLVRILIWSKRMRLIPKLKSVLEKLTTAGFRLNKELLEKIILEENDES